MTVEDTTQRRRTRYPDQLQVAISTHFHAGADPAKARAVCPHYHEYLRPKRPGGRGLVVSPVAFETGTGRHGAVMIGSADEITDKLLDAAKALGVGRIFFSQVDWGGLPPGPGRGVHRPLRHRDRSALRS
jgi:alkanesulfonate monooxygenase SsuD/methylene tetrahydromethanopterin reductase-like flavin-dependent oxidoreductase (luciferase family)